MSDRGDRIRDILTREFAPVGLDVVDESARHAGHAGARHAARGPEERGPGKRGPEERGPGDAGETHYAVAMVSPAFTGKNRLARSRAVHDALAGEFASGLHALRLSLKAPEEA